MGIEGNSCVYMRTHRMLSDVDDAVDLQVSMVTVLDVHEHCCQVVGGQISLCVRDLPAELVMRAVEANTGSAR